MPMLTREGADVTEIIVRPCDDGTWQVEIASSAGITFINVQTECDGVTLARARYPHAQIRILPSVESLKTLHDDDLSADSNLS
jgi:hypothetical protein